MKLVYICSPLSGDIEGNIHKAHEYCRMAVAMGTVPLAPHAIFTNYLDDREPCQRQHGLQMGLEVLLKCDELWAFGINITEGMEAEIRLAKENGIPVHLIIDPDNSSYYPYVNEVAEQISLYTHNYQ